MTIDDIRKLASEALRDASAIGAPRWSTVGELADAVDALLAVVDALPKCSDCEAQATTVSTRSGICLAGGVLRCDRCAAKWPTMGPTDLPYAGAVRALAVGTR